MADRTAYNDIKYLFFIPSFYGALTWGAWLVLYVMKLVKLDDLSGAAVSVFLFTEAMFILSAFVSFPYYRRIMQARQAESLDEGQESLSRLKTVILLLHAVGFLGLVQYVFEFSKNLGGITGFFLALVNEAYAIRWEAETSASIGTQLSYFGWIAIGLTVYQFSRKRLSGYWLVTALAQFLGNLLFIDRTRPIWIVFTSLLMILPVVKRLQVGKIVRWILGSLALVIVMFWLIAEWTGKTSYEGKFDNSVLPGITQEIYVYGVSGFAYFNKMLESNEELSYKPVRFFYPVLRYLSRLGIAGEPPGQVLEFYDVPFSTNVGTFLELFYRDGGLLFVLCGIAFYSFGIDCIGFLLLKSIRPIAIYAWSNLCYVTLFGFFTPKISSFPIWFFTGIALLSIGLSRSRTDAQQSNEHTEPSRF